MENFQLFLLVLQVIIAVSLIILVLLQKSDGDSLGGIGGGSGGLNGAISRRSAANILSKTTMILIAIFMLNCLILGAISKSDRKKISQELNQTIQQEEASEPALPVVE
jgi:preprotein translocase subunit SecG